MKDLTVILVNKPGTIADAFEALGGAGVNVVGTCGVARSFVASPTRAPTWTWPTSPRTAGSC